MKEKSIKRNFQTGIKKGFTRTLTLASLLCVFKRSFLTRLFSRKGLFFQNTRVKQQNTTPKLVCGFTMIELIVVIAVIGLLTTVVIAFLSSARAKSADSSVKASMTQIRTHAELYYSVNQNFTNMCITGAPGIAAILAQATSTGGGPTGSITDYCAGNASNWSAYSRLKTGGYWCVGSSGVARTAVSLPSPMQATSCI